MNHFDFAAQIRGRLVELGVVLPPGSRFDLMLRLYESNAVGGTFRKWIYYRQAKKDLQELNFVLQTLFAGQPNFTLLDTLRRSLKDALFPIRSATNAEGRNAQAELYVGALLKNAGLEPVKCDPPDYRFKHEDKEWALEVKRLQSERKLETRIREGFNALELTGIPGVLVLDIAQAFRNIPSRLGSIMPEALINHLWARRLKDFVDQNCPIEWLSEVRRGREIRGLVVLDHFVIPDARSDWRLHSMMFGICIDKYNQRREREFSGLFEIMRRGTAT